MSGIIKNNIPAELRALRQWICWELVPAEPKPKKEPRTVTGGHAKVNNPATWATFDECVAAYEQSLATDKPWAGVGFVFTSDDPYVGIDLDGMSWEQAQQLEGLGALLPCYVELSQSGKGIHLIMKGKLPPGQRRKGPIETYDERRYFATTGNAIDTTGGDLPGDLEDRTEALAAFHARHIGGFLEPGQGTVADAVSSADDQALLDRILAGRDGRRFHALFYGGDGNPHKRSESDFDLAALLCRYTADDEQVKRLMWASALKREKWEGHRTLVDITVRNARKANPGPLALTTDEPVDITALELAQNPGLLGQPASLSPWLTWRGEYTILVGREKLAGKTTAAASDAAAALRAGRRVLWITAEESQNRVLSRFKDLQAPLGNLILLRRWPQSWEEVEAAIQRRQPSVVYVDSQSSFLFAVDGEVPQTSELEKWQSKGLRFKSWAHLVPEHLAGVCVLVHANKATGEYAGSVGIGAAADTIITMRTVADRPNDRLLDKRGRWGFPSTTVRFVDPVQGYVDAPDTPAAPKQAAKLPKGEMKRMLDALTHSMAYSEWEKAFGGKADTFKSYVGRLTSRGLVTQDPASGKWSKREFEAQQELGAQEDLPEAA